MGYPQEEFNALGVALYKVNVSCDSIDNDKVKVVTMQIATAIVILTIAIHDSLTMALKINIL